MYSVEWHHMGHFIKTGSNSYLEKIKCIHILIDTGPLYPFTYFYFINNDAIFCMQILRSWDIIPWPQSLNSFIKSYIPLILVINAWVKKP